MATKFKITEIINLYNALSLLDTYPKVIKQGESESVSQVPYSFSGKLRWNITKNLNLLKPHVEDYSKVRDSLIKQFTAEGETTIDQKANPTGWKSFVEENEKLGANEVEFSNLLKLNVDELLKDSNPVPASVLSALDSLLTEPTS